MTLKAGRRGLNKRLVDAFGNFNGEVPSGEYYTKQQTDNKFETKTHVNNTFQKKTLEVPLEMLSGSKLTVEDALQGLNEEKFTYADNGVLGAKNLLPNNLTTDRLHNGITYHRNSDGSITINGTNDTENVSVCGISGDFSVYSTPIFKAGERLIFTCGADDTTNRRLLVRYTDNTYGQPLDNTVFIVPKDIGMVYTQVLGGVSVDNVTIYPMVRLASDPDDTYIPYAMTNRELTDMVTVESLTVNLTPIDKATILRDDSRRCGNVVNIRIQLQVTSEIANNTEIFRLDGLSHAGWGTAILADTNTGEIIPIVITASYNNFIASCRKTIPVGYYAISYSYIQ